MMKNKLFLAALSAALLCGLAFTACENEVMDVKVVYDKTAAVSGVTAVKTTAGDVIVSWDAVDGLVQYAVVQKIDGAKTVETVGYGQNLLTYDTTSGASSANTDPDKWSASISSSSLISGKSYVFGVVTYSQSSNDLPSDVKWSGAVAIP